MDICTHVFGKRHSELTLKERRRFNQLRNKASYYRRHAKNVDKQRVAKRSKKSRVIEAVGIPAKCQECGYDRYEGALDFHHKNATEKTAAVMSLGFSEAIAEAKKCRLLCANCHREAHRKERVTEMFYTFLQAELKQAMSGRPREHDPLLALYMEAAGCSEDAIRLAMADRPLGSPQETSAYLHHENSLPY